MARRGKKLPALNGSAMSDISFLLLTFFLLTSSINTDSGIQRRLPPPSDPNVKPPDIHKRNTFVVLVNMNDQIGLTYKGSVATVEISELKDKAKEFLSNPNNLADLPEKETKEIDLLGKVEVSKGVISLQNDRGTSYQMYLQVQNELMAAVNELRDDLAKEKFGRKYKDCNNSQMAAIDKAVPVAISEAEPKDVNAKKGGK